MAPSQLKRLKESLKESGITGHNVNQSKKKTTKQQEAKNKRQREDALVNIRRQFNPFDTKVNREKQEVLGRTTQGAVGKPGLAKQQGEDARRQAHDLERKRSNKVGGINDRRLGENDKNMTNEEKMLARFTKERQRNTKSMFDLEGDDDDLGIPMYGRSLAVEDDFEEDDLPMDEGGKSEGKRRRESKAGQEEKEEDDKPVVKKSKKEVMEEVIAKSKMHKYERQQAKENYINEVEELDDRENMADLLAEINKANAVKKVNNDDYDTAYDARVRALGMDKRAAPTSRTKTDEELAKEESEKLRKREAKRQARMMGEDVSDSESEAEEEPEEKEEEVPEDATAAHEFGLEVRKPHVDKSVGGEEEDEEASDDDDFHDIMDEDEDEDGDVETSQSEASEEGPEVEQPKTFTSASKCPQSVGELLPLLEGQGLDKQVATVKSILKQYHPNKAEGNKEKQGVLMTVLVEYLLYLVDHDTKLDGALESILEIIKKLSKDHYDHATLAKHFRQKLQIVSDKVAARLEGKSNFQLSPSHLLVFALIGTFFSTSDHYHQVCAPACIIIGQILTQFSVKSDHDMFVGVFLSRVVLSYQRIAERYMPEVPLFISQALCLLTGNRDEPRDVFLPKVKGFKIDVSKLPSGSKVIYVQDLNRAPSLRKQLFMQLLQLSEEFAKLWRNKLAYTEIFQPILATLQPYSQSSKSITSTVDKLQRFKKFATQERGPLTLQAHKPVPIASLTPKFEENYNLDVKSYDDDTTRKEIKKLQKEMKNEKKTAMKELRRDAAFNAREQISEKRAMYDKYHKDMARLYDQIQTEEGAEKNKYEREKAANKRAAKRKR